MDDARDFFEHGVTKLVPHVEQALMGALVITEYALRGGADGVIITGCRGGGCLHRLGNLWTAQRIAGVREPHLRGTVPQERIGIVWADRQEKDALSAAVEAFAQDIEALGDRAKRPQPYSRRIKYG